MPMRSIWIPRAGPRESYFAYKNVLMTLLNIKIALLPLLFLRRQYRNQLVATFS